MLRFQPARAARTVLGVLTGIASAALVASAYFSGAAAAQLGGRFATRVFGGVQAATTPQLVYVSLPSLGSVVAYPVGTTTVPPPAESISGLAGPAGLAVDGAGNLYVAESLAKDVKVFAPGKTSAFRTLVAPPGSARLSGVAVDARGTVYAATLNGAIYVYPNLANTPSATLSDPSIMAASQIAVDNAGNVYAAVVCGGAPGIGVFLASSSIGFGFFQLLQLAYATPTGFVPDPTDVAVSPLGLLVTDDTPNAAGFLPYPPATQKPVLRFPIAGGGAASYLTALTSSASPQLFVASGNNGGVLYEYVLSTGKLQTQIPLRTTVISGLATSPAAQAGTW